MALMIIVHVCTIFINEDSCCEQKELVSRNKAKHFGQTRLQGCNILDHLIRKVFLLFGFERFYSSNDERNMSRR